MTTTTSIWWIRRDLRLTDNQALSAAMAAAGCVIPLFILDPKLLTSPYNSPRRTSFLLEGLKQLDADLRERGSRLVVRYGEPLEQLQLLVSEGNASVICAEADYSPYATKRDKRIQEHLPLQLTDGVTIRPVGSVLKKDGTPYTVFTPYSKVWKRHQPIARDQILASPQSISSQPISSLPISKLETIESLSIPVPDESQISGERAGKGLLSVFVELENGSIYDYAQKRDFPEIEGTSRLSPYLRFGMVSSRVAALVAYEAIDRISTMEKSTLADSKSGAEVWLDELIWRDFYTTILAYYPSVRGNSFRPDYDRIEWANDKHDFSAWCEGKTGYPFIDAAMRQLLNTGWMHNRARMAVASFLVKDLLIDWRWGERWFMQQLLDGDPAANNGGWQWSAGTGTDAAPYFRIFNPISQGKKFDKEGNYVRRWVPELAMVPNKFIHEPWLMSPDKQHQAGCRIGKEYPAPIIDHKWARERTLAAYKKAKA